MPTYWPQCKVLLSFCHVLIVSVHCSRQEKPRIAGFIAVARSHQRRPHSALGWMTPSEFAEKSVDCQNIQLTWSQLFLIMTGSYSGSGSVWWWPSTPAPGVSPSIILSRNLCPKVSFFAFTQAASLARLPSLRNQKNALRSKPSIFRKLNESHQYIQHTNYLKCSFIFWKWPFPVKGYYLYNE